MQHILAVILTNVFAIYFLDQTDNVLVFLGGIVVLSVISTAILLHFSYITWVKGKIDSAR